MKHTLDDILDEKPKCLLDLVYTGLKPAKDNGKLCLCMLEVGKTYDVYSNGENVYRAVYAGDSSCTIGLCDTDYVIFEVNGMPMWLKLTDAYDLEFEEVEG